ncbi:MAG: hypothetical protein WCK28_01185 [Burkholderiales bacterium]|jgi:hypothetical protein
MKTTLELDDDLLRRAKQAALDRDTTLRAIVEEALLLALGRPTAPVPIRTVVWPPRPVDGRAPAADDATDWLAEIKRVRYGASDGHEAGGVKAPARAKSRKRR